MRAHDLDLAEVRGTRQQLLRDVQRHFPDDHDVGVDEPVQRHVDRALGGVLDGHHAVLRASALHLVEDLGVAADRQELRGRAEPAHRRLMGEGRRRAQVGHGQGMLERQRGGQDLAPDGAHGISAERPGIAGGKPIEDLRLALGNEVRKVLLPLELADLEGDLSASVEEGKDLFVEVIDPGTPIVQVHSSS